MNGNQKTPGRAEKRRQILLGRLVCIAVSLIVGFLIGIVIGRLLPADDRQTVQPGTGTVTQAPTDEPTGVPNDGPTAEVTAGPTDEPTDRPTDEPTAEVTVEPTAEITAGPTDEPTDGPTAEIAEESAGKPTAGKTEKPTDVPTDEVQTEVSAAPANPMAQAEPEKEVLPLTGVRIGIDPGHQQKGNSGQEPVFPGSSETKAKVSSGTQGVSTRVPEYAVNLDVSLMLRDALEELGAEVFMTRETNEVDISNVERATMMNDIGVDLVLRLHCNGSTNSSTQGISLFIKPSGEGAEESCLASEALLPAMLEATGAKNQGIHKRDTYSGLNWSTVPSILVEMGFMSNAEEDELLNDPDYQQKLVSGMVQGIADYMGRELETAAAE